MPGVPTFRGCDACHKQKKKCDQASPKCARCARLNIPCTGKGQLRYKFKEQCINFAPAKTSRRKSSSPKSLSPPASPSNQVTRLSARLAYALQIDDPQFDLSCFGAWFAHIPIRMGVCELLDNVTEAFLDAHDDLRSGHQSPTTMSKSGKAFASLENALKDPRQKQSPYTLCATFLFMVAQMWAFKSAKGYISHMEVICHLLNATIDKPWNDDFVRSLRYHLIIPACTEAIFNPNISIDAENLKIIGTNTAPPQPLDEEKGQIIESLDLPFLMRFQYFTREPERYHNDMIREYTRMKIECPFVLHRLMELTDIADKKRKPEAALVRARRLMGEAYSRLLSFTLVINAFLSAMDPINNELYNEAQKYSEKAIWITSILSRQQAVEAGFMPAALFSAWIATDNSKVISSIRSIMEQCDSYWAEEHYMDQFTRMKERVREIRHRKLQKLLAGGLQGVDVTEFTTEDGSEYTYGPGAPLGDWRALQNGNPRAMVSAASCLQDQGKVDIQLRAHSAAVAAAFLI